MTSDNPVLIFGATALGRAAKEIFESNGRVVYGFLDDDKSRHNTEIDSVRVLGSTDDDGFLKFIGKKCDAFIAIDDQPVRKSLTRMVQEVRHVQVVNGFHKLALVSPTCTFGHGNLVSAGVFLGAASRIGNHCIVHAGAIIDAQATLGDFVQVGAGTIINSNVTVGNGAFIGSGVVIVSGVQIGKGARVGAGSVVIGSVKENETVFGNPAATVKG